MYKNAPNQTDTTKLSPKKPKTKTILLYICLAVLTFFHIILEEDGYYKRLVRAIKSGNSTQKENM